jgi:hypothetical protein
MAERRAEGAARADPDIDSVPTAPTDIAALDHLDRAEDVAELREVVTWLKAATIVEPGRELAGALQSTLHEHLDRIDRSIEAADPGSVVPALRECLQVLATLRTLGHWQSPITGDGAFPYHRQHVALDGWGRALLAAEGGARARPERSLLFSSFMGGIAAFLHASPAGTVLADRASYHETRQVLAGLRGHEVELVDPRMPGALVAALAAYEPRAILIDLAPNDPALPVTDLPQVVQALAAVEPSGPRWLLLDHSLTGPLWEPPGGSPWPTDLIASGRSLQKLDQRGLDLAAAGVITVHAGPDVAMAELERSRAVLGVVLPERDRWFLECGHQARHRRRRVRAYRNGAWIRCGLQRSLARWPGIRLHHPSDPRHMIWNMRPPRWRWCPPIMFITLPTEVGVILDDEDERARLAGEVAVPFGASFGFRDTRVSGWVDADHYALRINLGLESAGAVEPLTGELARLLDLLWDRGGRPPAQRIRR